MVAYIAITKNNRRITDSSFRAQLIYTIDQIENIYWGLVGAYQDERAKEGALKPIHAAALRRPKATTDRHPRPAGCGERQRPGRQR